MLSMKWNQSSYQLVYANDLVANLQIGNPPGFRKLSRYLGV